MKTDVHNEDFFLRLVSKERLKGTRKWSTTMHHPVNSARREFRFILSKKDAPGGGGGHMLGAQPLKKSSN